MSKTKDAIALLKADHEKVKGIFEKFEKSDSQEEKNSLIDQALEELKVHAEVEEELFYPALRGEVENDLMNEADEEHHVARILIAELEEGDEEDDERRNAKFTVLAESIRHHIKEEEGEMMPQAKDAGVDLDSLGERIQERKNELMESGVPADDEHQMVSGAGMKSGRSRRSGLSEETQFAVARNTSVAGSKAKSSRKSTSRTKRSA
jgi:hemerythrin-like domain-containing protein